MDDFCKRKRLLVIPLLWSVTFGTYAETSSLLPDTSQITEMYDSVQSSIDGMFNFNPDEVATQGATGEDSAQDTSTSSDTKAETSNSSGGVKSDLVQRAAWSFEDEYSLFQNDLSDMGKTMDCLQYSMVGGCLSVRWTMFGPVFTTSFAVEHFIRDLHVEVMPQASSETNPFQYQPKTKLVSSSSLASDAILMYPTGWKLARMLGDSLLMNKLSSNLLEAEGQTTLSRRNRYLYSDVHVAGNVERGMSDMIAKSWLSSFGYCDSGTMNGVVYFSSQLDQFSWRWLATTESILMGLYQALYLEWNDIGRSYGSTFPRTGYITHQHRFKTSVISAIRAVSIPSENRALFSGLAGLHIYLPLNTYANSSYRSNEYLTPQDAKSFKLTMIYPFQGETCTRYGSDQSIFGSLTDTDIFKDDRLQKKFVKSNPNNTAAFKVYRPYRCCRINGSQVMSWTSPGPIGLPRTSPIQ